MNPCSGVVRRNGQLRPCLKPEGHWGMHDAAGLSAAFVECQQQRKPLPARSSKYRDVPDSVRAEVRRRSEGHCELCGSSGDHMHHRKQRALGGRHEAANLLHVCWLCHDDIHGNIARSEALGWLVRSSVDPADVPVTTPERVA